MATQGKRAWKYVGSAALTGGELLKLGANKGECDVAGAVTDKVIGVAGQAVAAGNVTAQNISVITPADEPTVQVIASAAITLGAYLKAATGGKVVTATPAATYTASVVDVILGIAIEAAGADGDVIEMMWHVGTSQSQ